MARRSFVAEEEPAHTDEEAEGVLTSDDFFEQEIDQGELTELQMEAEAEEEARRAPPGNYFTVTPYPVKREKREMKVIDGDGSEVAFTRQGYNYFGDAISEDDADKKYKLSLSVSPVTLYVIYSTVAGEPPTFYTTKADGAQLDSASKNYSKAAKLYEKATGQKAVRYADIEAFLSETQLRLRVIKFKSGKSGVVGFDLAS